MSYPCSSLSSRKPFRIAFLICLCLFIPFDDSALAATNAQMFTYQGRFLNAAGTAPLTDVVDVTFSIYDPGATCLLYEEKQSNIDLSTSEGLFSVQIGTAIGAAKRTPNDPGLSMAAVFSNSTSITGSSGCNYTPSAGNNRRLKISVLPHSTGIATALSPDQAINSVPQAQIAETLQGLDPTGFIQSAAGVAGQSNVDLANLITLTGGGDASTLHQHDGRYVRLGAGASSTNLGSNGAYTTGALGIFF